MSGYLAGKIWHSALDPDLKALAANLADIADDDGSNIYPSIEFVAWRLGRSRSAVQAGMGKLRQQGILEVVEAGGGRNKPTEYKMEESKLPKRESWREFKAKRNSPADATVSVNSPVCEDKQPGLEAETALSAGPNSNSLPVREPVREALPLNLEPGRPQPKPVREPKVRKGFQKTLPPRREYVRPAKPSETWNRFAVLYKSITDFIPVSYPELRESHDRFLGEIGQAELEWRLSRWAEERDKRLSEWAVKDFLEGEWKLVGKEAGDIPGIVNEE